METHVYKPIGVCSREMKISYEGDTIVNVEVVGGCNGNLQGLSSLVKGMKLQDAIERLEGIKCGMKNTSCPDQMSKAFKEIVNK
ncbi:MAG: TIGR03905 family TSCPD domain-containing protein [Bacilli bacterium]|nr:TIGR03905 family TSCPD domain-containing protein [Bacilli bacterium]